MTRDEMLLGWLCILRYQLSAEDDAPFALPDGIEGELVAKGWVELIPEADWRGHSGLSITDAGCAVTDINAADWGIELEMEVEP